MRRILPILLLSLAVSNSLFAQSFGFGVHGNMSNFQLNAKLTDLAGLNQGTPANIALQQVYGLGYGGGAHLDLGFAILSLRLSGDYFQLSPDLDKFKTFVTTYIGLTPANLAIDGGKITVISGILNAKLVVLPLPVFHVYVTAGAGLANVKADKANISASLGSTPVKTSITLLKDQQTVSTFNGGAGVDIALGPVTIYGEIKINLYNLSEGSGTYLPLITAGVTF